MADQRLVIIDGYSLLFRAFYGTRYLSTSDGRPTNALYGFVGMLFRLLEEIRPNAVVVALDAPGKTFRHTEYADYKATRKEAPDELSQQLEQSRELIKAFGIPCIELIGYEADDVVGTISRQAEANGYDTTIVTGDLDALQLVDDCVSVMTTRRGVTDVVIYDTEAVKKRYGFGPEHVTDYKALVGDTSDNIPGVAGIGDKGATELIQQFGTVESMLERFDEVPLKYQKKIEPQKEEMTRSKWLATINREAPIEYDFKPYVVSRETLQAAQEFLMRFEMRNPLRSLEAVLAPFAEEGAIERAEAVKVGEQALEPEVLESVSSRLVLNSWVGDKPFSVYLPEGEELLDEAVLAVENEVRRIGRQEAYALLAERRGQAVLHDAKRHYRAQNELTREAVRFDSLIAGYVLQPGRSSYLLEDMVPGYTDYRAPETDEQKAVAALVLEQPLRERLKLENQSRIYEQIESPLIPLLAEMEAHGVRTDCDYLNDLSKQLQVSIEKTQAAIYEMAGEQFNIGSPKQLGEILFGKLEIPGSRKTKTGYSTSADILLELAPNYPIISEILAYRELTKLKSTYADALPKLVREDGRIHTTYNQAIAATGRLSSVEPNLQNIPIRTEMGRKIRKAFVASEGCRLLSFDYSQIELRILAHMCQDEALVNAFQTGLDVHRATAAQMFHKEPDEVSREERGYAKLLNYAVLYGVTDFGLKQQLGENFSRAEAKELIQKYNERFPRVRDFMDETVEDARSKGFTTTLWGRRRYFADIHAGNRVQRAGAERQAMNAPIQGTAADMMKLAMLRVRDVIDGTDIKMLMSVHDEIVLEVPEGSDEKFEAIREAMAGALPLNVPIEVDGKIGYDWYETTPVQSL